MPLTKATFLTAPDDVDEPELLAGELEPHAASPSAVAMHALDTRATCRPGAASLWCRLRLLVVTRLGMTNLLLCG